MISMPDLRATIDGQVIAPEDPEYDEARAVFYGGLDPRPAVIVKVAGADDVARVIAFARETGLELAVRSGGHSGAGHCTTDGGIVLDLSSLKAIDIDARGRTAWAETGLTAGEFSTAVGAHGLALAFGDTGSVGIGGITLGGGIGYLVRKQGLTIDSLLAADVVTADGELVRADESTLPDLFWAIRGGGGNFGVATRSCSRRARTPSRASSPPPRRHPRSCRPSRTSCPRRRCRSCRRSITGSSRSWRSWPMPVTLSAASAPWRRSVRWPHPSPTSCGPCHMRRSIRPTIPRITRSRRGARCSWTTSSTTTRGR